MGAFGHAPGTECDGATRAPGGPELLRSALRSLWLTAICLSAAAAPVFAAGDPFGPSDLFHIYYPRNACESDHIEVEVWDVRADAWLPHAHHPLVPVETCQLEKPGGEFFDCVVNELKRVR